MKKQIRKNLVWSAATLLTVMMSACHLDEGSITGRNPRQWPERSDGECYTRSLKVTQQTTSGPVPSTCASPVDAIVSATFVEGEQKIHFTVKKIGDHFPSIPTLSFVPAYELT